jgi:cytoskeleton protein RodZ
VTSIGQVLAEARTNAGLSVADVSAKTRLRQTIVNAIEADHFEPCGGAIYARGHIRNISAVVGCDAEPLLAMFDAQYGNPSESLVDLIQDSGTFERRRELPWSRLMGAAGAVVVLLLGFAIYTGGEAIAPTTGPNIAATPTPTQPEASETEPSVPPVASRPDEVTLVIRAVQGSSWLAVSNSDGRQIYTGILRRGSELSFDDPQRLRVVLGNAGGVELTVNGEDLGTPGGEGQVLRLDFTPSDGSAG